MGNFEVMGGVRLARDHSAWLGTTASRVGPVDRVRVHKLATPLGIEPRISGFIRGSSLNLSWPHYPRYHHVRIPFLPVEPYISLAIDITYRPGFPSLDRIGDRLVRGSNSPSQLEQIPDHRDMDPQYATVDQLAEITDTMASLRDAILGLGQRIDGHQAQPLPIPGSTLHDSTTPPPTTTHRFSQLPRLEHLCCMVRLRLRRILLWHRHRLLMIPRLGAPVFTCSYTTVMRGHRLDEAQMIMLFPLSLSGAAQRWFASLDPSRRRTWADLGQEFIRQYSFNTIVDVSRRELEALRQGPDETVTSFISRWRGR
ncbi:hypothetical protein CK203_062989 [Vitis vinifera]|uniref:Retrotransposon gag domain-containing protein n=1 Tax=Vitis vinifera TaxID=29760 RepID=A0A438G977_VITVI|nr:hypothetical protein CK203_062989 [Vitis vinifera]